jgi:hypothetical protein
VKILVDEDLPRYLKRVLPGHDIATVQEMGWAGIKNGPLLRLAEPMFDLFLTGDKNLRYQQNLKGRKLAIIVFLSNKLSVVKTLVPRLQAVIAQVQIGAYIEI